MVIKRYRVSSIKYQVSSEEEIKKEIDACEKQYIAYSIKYRVYSEEKKRKEKKYKKKIADRETLYSIEYIVYSEEGIKKKIYARCKLQVARCKFSVVSL